MGTGEEQHVEKAVCINSPCQTQTAAYGSLHKSIPLFNIQAFIGVTAYGSHRALTPLMHVKIIQNN